MKTTLLVSALFAVMIAASLVFVRLLILLHTPKTPQKTARLMVLLGSGGHTGEMLRLLEPLKLTKYSSRMWVYSSGDDISAKRAVEFEKKHHSDPATSYKITSVARARNVGQPWSTTWISTLKSLSECISLARTNPDVLVCNGPGTSVPLCLATFILRFVGVIDTRIIFVESLARVHSLSLSGMILLPIADRFIVQWPAVAAKYRRAEYYGLLV